MSMYQGGYLIGQIHKRTGRRINELLKEQGITEFNGAQGTILYSLWNRESMTIKEIAAVTGLAKTSLTSMLERMRQAGLLVLEDNPQDGRSKIVKLTGKAGDLKEEYESVSASMTECWYRGMQEEEILQFEETLRKVLRNIEEY
ncbi:MAG: MarR family transcriptional regulator [Solobacterium sp.]|nr:MarR family transcriptional regulator [Solobacterium sp.]